MMSHASASSSPPPTATPLIAAMIGFGQSKSRVIRPNGGRASPCTSPPSAVRSAVALRSLPAENARSPAPVRIATQTPGSSRKSSQISASSLCASRCNAFITSGRFSVTYAIRPRFSYVANR